MCGLFGWCGPAGSLDPARIVAAARMAATRGPHAHGWAALHDGDPVPDLFRSLGPWDTEAERKLTEVIAAGTVTAIVGHCRLATVSAFSVRDERDVQPLRSSTMTLVHNGNVDVPETYRTRMVTGNDSEAILTACLRPTPIGLGDALDRLNLVQKPHALLAMPDLGGLIASRYKLPLFIHRTDGILCSRPIDGEASALPAERIVHLKPKDPDA